MHFKPKTENDIARERLRPDGEYPFTVYSAIEKVSKAGNPMIVVELDVFDPMGNQFSVTDYLMESMAFKLRHFCYGIGLSAEYDNGTLEAAAIVGRSGSLKLSFQEANGNFPPKNVVKDYIKEPSGSAPKQTIKPVAAAPIQPDPNDPPF